jgi:hypothetical protein
MNIYVFDVFFNLITTKTDKTNKICWSVLQIFQDKTKRASVRHGLLQWGKVRSCYGGVFGQTL